MRFEGLVRFLDLQESRPIWSNIGLILSIASIICGILMSLTTMAV